MGSRTKKLVGAIILVAFVVVYFFVATALTSVMFGDKPSLIAGMGYAFFGLIWIVPAGAIISWMSKP
jgi:hypothetical protein